MSKSFLLVALAVAAAPLPDNVAAQLDAALEEGQRVRHIRTFAISMHSEIVRQEISKCIPRSQKFKDECTLKNVTEASCNTYMCMDPWGRADEASCGKCVYLGTQDSEIMSEAECMAVDVGKCAEGNSVVPGFYETTTEAECINRPQRFECSDKTFLGQGDCESNQNTWEAVVFNFEKADPMWEKGNWDVGGSVDSLCCSEGDLRCENDENGEGYEGFMPCCDECIGEDPPSFCFQASFNYTELTYVGGPSVCSTENFACLTCEDANGDFHEASTEEGCLERGVCRVDGVSVQRDRVSCGKCMAATEPNQPGQDAPVGQDETSCLSSGNAWVAGEWEDPTWTVDAASSRDECESLSRCFECSVADKWDYDSCRTGGTCSGKSSHVSDGEIHSGESCERLGKCMQSSDTEYASRVSSSLQCQSMGSCVAYNGTVIEFGQASIPIDGQSSCEGLGKCSYSSIEYEQECVNTGKCTDIANSSIEYAMYEAECTTPRCSLDTIDFKADCIAANETWVPTRQWELYTWQSEGATWESYSFVPGTWTPATLTEVAAVDEDECRDRGAIWKRNSRWEEGDIVVGFPMRGYDESGVCTEFTDAGELDCQTTCSTGPEIDLEGLENNIEQFMADVAANISAADAYAANPQYYSDFGMYLTFLANAQVHQSVNPAASTASIKAVSGFLPLFYSHTNGIIETTGESVSMLVVDPAVYGGEMDFVYGSAVVVGGEVYSGAARFTTVGKVVVSDLVNNATVDIENSQDVFIGSVTNFNNITLKDINAKFVEVVTSGHVTANGGVYNVINIINDGVFSVDNAVVGGVCACPCNRGTIYLGANVTGTVYVEEGCMGDIKNMGSASLVEYGAGGELTAEPTAPASEPTAAASEPTSAASEPTSAASEPTAAASEPTAANSEPTSAASEPTSESTSEPTAAEPTAADGREISRSHTHFMSALAILALVVHL